MRNSVKLLAVIASLSSLAAFGADAPDKKTERTWKAKCGSCHGADGKGATEQGQKMKVRDLSAAAYQKEATDEAIKKSILEGVNRTENGVKQEMDAYKDTLKPEQIDALVKYVRALASK